MIFLTSSTPLQHVFVHILPIISVLSQFFYCVPDFYVLTVLQWGWQYTSTHSVRETQGVCVQKQEGSHWGIQGPAEREGSVPFHHFCYMLKYIMEIFPSRSCFLILWILVVTKKYQGEKKSFTYSYYDYHSALTRVVPLLLAWRKWLVYNCKVMLQ